MFNAPARPAMLLAALLILLAPVSASATRLAADAELGPIAGGLHALDEQGEAVGHCPLKHTDVEVHVSGHFTRVDVTQRYHNPYEHKIEAVYTFPLSHRAAVDRMTMTVGDRVVQGEVRQRDAARRIYEAARRAGHVSSLLEQERPNIFTQSVANIEPGAEVEIRISYVEVLESSDGEYRLSFPMVIAPRYTPGRGDSPARELPAPGHGFAGDTDQVPDASRVTPMPVRPEERAGHDINLTVHIDTGGPAIAQLASASHDITRVNHAPGRASISLAAGDTIPNRDFRLAWRLVTDEITEAILTHTGNYGSFEGGFVTLMLQPPARVDDADVRPRELIFVLDNSGSMRSARLADRSALDAAKDVINQAIDTMRDDDRFNIVSFNNTLDVLWDRPMPATTNHRAAAQRYVDRRQGGGGTEMRNAVLRALHAGPFRDRRRHDRRRHDHDDYDHDDDVQPMRIVLFVTDGLVSNDAAIIDAIRDHAHETRVFTVGMSHAPNRHLLDEMARVGRGASDYILPSDDVTPIVRRFAHRIATPVLTDIELTALGGIELIDMLPSAEQMPDLFDFQPLVIHARYRRAGHGQLRIRGRTGGGAYERVVNLHLPAMELRHDTIATLWARGKVGELMRGGGGERMDEQQTIARIVELGETFQLVTHHTSFVAVERQRVTLGGQPVLVRVPIEFPKGMSWEGIFGESLDDEQIVEPMPRLMQRDGRHERLAGSPPAEAPRRLQSRGGRGGRSARTVALGDVDAPSAPAEGVAGAMVVNGQVIEAELSTHFFAQHGLPARARGGRLDNAGQVHPADMPPFGHLTRVVLPNAAVDGIPERLRTILADEEGNADRLGRVLTHPDSRDVILIVPAAVAELLRPFTEAIAAENVSDAARERAIAALDREAPALRRRLELRRILDDELHEHVTAATPQDQPLEVSVLLEQVEPAALARLADVGFELDASADAASFVVGRATPTALRRLAQVDGVRRIEALHAVEPR